MHLTRRWSTRGIFPDAGPSPPANRRGAVSQRPRRPRSAVRRQRGSHRAYGFTQKHGDKHVAMPAESREVSPTVATPGV